ncbi:protein CWC15 homolog [Condylostylus longicornis]|uniref:protein CWC15 homolog n=1 Tax=Condylostylus longicornis TaxID=2530218 RepID=UPI00244DCB57|nr:protein CWC15 homolog [Condylostylus longicornis]
MTTAARPTFDPARGGTGRGEKDLSALSKQYSSRDLPGHTKLKYRQEGQGTNDELRSRDFRKELDDREREARSKNIPATVRKAIEANSSSTASAPKRPKLDSVPPANLDADDPVDNDSSEEEDSDDDTAALLAELNKIKQERAQEESKKEKERKEQEEKIRMENILQGNPLLNYSSGAKSGDLKVKRRWDDDVVFKNCARNEPDKKSHFINDSLRSEFHKKFMEKYIK